MRSLILQLFLILALALPAQAQRTIAPKPLPGAVELSLSGKGAPARRAIKAQALAAVGKVANFSATKNARTFDIELREAPVVVDGVLTVYARAKENGEAVGLGVREVEWERFRFVNPPVKVPAGTYREETIDGQTVQVENFREDAGAALREIIAHAVGVVAKSGPPRKPGSIGHTTTTVYGYNDATMGRSLTDTAGEDWSVLVAGAGNNISGTNGQYTVILYGLSDSLSNKWRANWSYPIAFDTSVLGGDIVVSATYSYSQNDKADTFTGGSGVSLCVVGWTPAIDVDTIGLGDYGQLGASIFGQVAHTATTNGVYNDIALNASGIAAIDPFGYTTLGLRSDAAISGTPPTWEATKNFRIRAYGVDTAGQVTDPKLTIQSRPRGPRNLLGAPL